MAGLIKRQPPKCHFRVLSFANPGAQTDLANIAAQRELWRIDQPQYNHNGTPSDNPFINQANKLDEIYAYGLRNPWKISFDSEDTLYAAGVGQNHIEEINIIKKGELWDSLFL